MSTHIITDLGTLGNHDTLRPLFTALDLAERALFGTPASPIISLCEARECTTYAAACLTVAGDEDEGRYTVPVQCRVCGGWFVVDEEVTS